MFSFFIYIKPADNRKNDHEREDKLYLHECKRFFIGRKDYQSIKRIVQGMQFYTYKNI